MAQFQVHRFNCFLGVVTWLVKGRQIRNSGISSNTVNKDIFWKLVSHRIQRRNFQVHRFNCFLLREVGVVTWLVKGRQIRNSGISSNTVNKDIFWKLVSHRIQRCNLQVHTTNFKFCRKSGNFAGNWGKTMGYRLMFFQILANRCPPQILLISTYSKSLFRTEYNGATCRSIRPTSNFAGNQGILPEIGEKPWAIDLCFSKFWQIGVLLKYC